MRPQGDRVARVRYADWNFNSDQKPGADHPASSQSAGRCSQRWSTRVLFAAFVLAKRIDGDVSIPDGYGLATYGLARKGESVVFARYSRISDHTGIAAASE